MLFPRATLAGFALFLALACGACSSGGVAADPAEPAFGVQLFSAGSSDIDNSYFPLVPGYVYTFRAETEDGVETVIVEDTHDWFAQDDDGNVWYMGEEVVNYEYDDDDNLLGTNDDGAWEAGVDGAEPGIVMKAMLVPGDSYRQEYYAGEAEDMGEIVALDVLVTLADGSTFSCLKTRDWTPLEPGVVEFKYYAPGVGMVAEEKEDGSERAELLGMFDLGDGALPVFGTAAFTNPTQIDNTYLPLSPGTVLEYELETVDGTESTVVEVLATTRVVDGVECVVVRDRVYLDGLLIEDTHDWFAQDDDGNVWYMGEEVVNYEYDDDDNLLGTDDGGSWEAGVDGALPGIVMWASPVRGTPYRQEFYEDEAEDMAVVVATGVTVVLGDGSIFTNCLQTLEWTPLEPFALEYKYYAPGVGVVAEETPGDGERVELVAGP